jgi:hypothetical protein
MERRRLNIEGIDKIVGEDIAVHWKVKSVGKSLDSYIFEIIEDVDGFTNRNIVKLWRMGNWKMGEISFKIDTSNSNGKEHWVSTNQIRNMNELGVYLIYVVQRDRV